MADYVKVAKTNEIEPGQARLGDVKGKSIALFNVDGPFFALDATCTHRGRPLAEGEISGHKVTHPGQCRHLAAMRWATPETNVVDRH